MTRAKATDDLLAEIRGQVDRPSNDIPVESPSVGMAGLYGPAVDAIRGGDESAAREALRQLDEPAPRRILPYFSLLLSEHERLSAIVAAGEGQADRAQRIALGGNMLRQKQPATAAEAEKLAGELLEMERQQHQAENAAGLAANAFQRLAAIESLVPQLFGLPASRQTTVGSHMLPEAVANWPLKNSLDILYTQGWAFSKLVAPRSAPRRRLLAVGDNRTSQDVENDKATLSRHMGR